MKFGVGQLTCQELVEFLANYLAGELDSDQRLVFERHLAECPECVTYLRGYAETVRLARDAYADDRVPATVPEGLVRAILEARQPSRGLSDPPARGPRRRP
jgi:anti-sigma factor RsiW